ncbi:hypothetical protein PRZ48_013336 [Zasmidium cellare]|uniref:Uncharacterized protein n=1 Tax=Zasmidium cellare TaxID=395010 RepID=A0ABR0E0R6_ZASCE|nr:hypothetical protein PRZ48_013336 [Zasmidium cellare]
MDDLNLASNMSTEQSSLSGRAPPSPPPYVAAAIAKGKKLIEAMNAAPDCSDSFQSKWTNIKDLQKPASGWIEEGGFPFDIPEAEGSGFGTAAQMIGINPGTDNGRNHAIGWKHTRTQASFNGIYNPARGVIISDGIWSPRHHGAHGNAVPEISQWSDVTFLQWQELTKDNGMLDKLQFVVHPNILPGVAKDIMKYLANDKLDEAKPPGYSFNLGTDGFAALLGSPLGAGTAYLLAQHKKQLGWKRVQSIKIFTVGQQESAEYQFILTIVPHPQSSSQQPGQRPSVRSEAVIGEDEATALDGLDHLTIEESSAPGRSSSNHGSAFKGNHMKRHNISDSKGGRRFQSIRRRCEEANLKRADKGESSTSPPLPLEDAVAKGQEVEALLSVKDGCDQIKPSEWKDFKSLGDWGWTTDTKYSFDRPKTYQIAQADNCVKPVIEQLYGNSQEEVPIIYKAQWEHSKPTTHDGQVYHPTHAYYLNHYTPKAIFGEANESPASKGPGESPPAGSPDRPLPKLQRWSDVVFIQQLERSRELHAQMRELEAVVRCEITLSSPSIGIVNEVTKVGNGKKPPGFAQAVSFTPGSKEFSALMGTPHGRGTAWFLLQHRDQLGRKCVVQIKVWWGSSDVPMPNVWYQLKEC